MKSHGWSEYEASRTPRAPLCAGRSPARELRWERASSFRTVHPPSGLAPIGGDADDAPMDDTRYVRTVDGIHVAYRTIGQATPDIVFTPGFISNVDTAAADGGHAELLRKLAQLGRVILFDRRGTGLSDRPADAGSLALELGVNDLTAVLDAADVERAVLFGFEDGGTLAAMFAAANPDRAAALVLFSPWVKGSRSTDYPWAWSDEEQRSFDRWVEEAWGTQEFARELLTSEAPNLALEERFVRGFARYLRSCASPGTVLAIQEMQADIDARRILPTISVPTLILRRTESARSADEIEAITRMIPAARSVGLPGDEQVPFLGDIDALVAQIGSFLDEVRGEERAFDRYLATVLFTDIVGSTAHAADLGDERWKEMLERHHAVVRAMLARYRGIEIDTAGDGFFSTFDGPARAVRCAQRIVAALAPLGLEVRAGVHTGEVQTIDSKIGGMGVVIGARVGALASASEVLVSQTVKDLVAGSGLAFADAGEHELKGVPDRWRLYRAVS